MTFPTLQELIDKTLPLRASASRILNTSAGRPVLALLVSAYSRVRRGEFIAVRFHEGLWVHRHREGYVVNRLIDTTTIATMASVAKETFLHGLVLSPGDTVVDVGAGIGTELLSFAPLVAPGGRYLAIEAHPETARCLEANRDRNHLSRVDVVNCAAVEQEGAVRISEDAEHILSKLETSDSQGNILVPGRRLDDILRELGVERVDLLKMNIEGAELMALRGLGQRLADVRQVAISCHDFLAQSEDDYCRTFEKVGALLRGAGFTTWSRENDSRPWVAFTWYGKRDT